MKLRTVKEYYDTGAIRREYTENESGQKHGTYRDWHHTGQLWEQREYQNGKRHGIFYIWNRNGSLNFICQYDNGILLVEVVYLRNPILITIHHPTFESTSFIANITSQLTADGNEYEIAHS